MKRNESSNSLSGVLGSLTPTLTLPSTLTPTPALALALTLTLNPKPHPHPHLTPSSTLALTRYALHRVADDAHRAAELRHSYRLHYRWVPPGPANP